ncbi:MAG: hypothetical protein K5776_01460 [Lachnospiraceae bacterium]|nr:hypothetical protein [Lachnospiraceae bacterium]
MNDKNPVRQAKIENFKKASELPLKKRIRFYWDFFKFYLLAAVLLAAFIYIVLTQMVFAPKTVFNGYIINRSAVTVISDDEFIRSFPAYSNIDTKKNRILFSSDMILNDSDLEAAAKIVATMSTGEVDVVICNKETAERLAQMYLISNLELYPELMSGYSENLLTYDHTKNDTDEDDSFGIKAYGIDVSDSAALKSLNAFKEGEKVYICIGKNIMLNDLSHEFIKWIANP